MPDGRPPDNSPPLRIFISAAEPSGDRHAAALIRTIRQLDPAVTFWGVAGPLMQAEGCEPIDDMTQRSAMLVGAVRLAGHAWRLVRRVGKLIAEQPTQLAILVDSPALHLPMAKHIRAAGVPVLYYIAPQLWAWAPWRIGRVRRRVNRLAAILPFEESYFRSRGVEADFVGHPLIEQLEAVRPDPSRVAEFKQLGSPVVACLPGSRRHVIEEVLPGQIEVVSAIAKKHPTAGFLFAAADETAAATIRDALGVDPETRVGPASSRSAFRVSGCTPSGRNLRHRVEVGSNAEILAAADLALVASGTATLEVAWHRLPMVVMYNGSKWGYRLVGRFLITTPHLCLVNILAGKRAVPEFMPYYTSTAPIAAEALDLLANASRREAVKRDLDAVIRSLGAHAAAPRVALLALSMARHLLE